MEGSRGGRTIPASAPSLGPTTAALRIRSVTENPAVQGELAKLTINTSPRASMSGGVGSPASPSTSPLSERAPLLAQATGPAAGRGTSAYATTTGGNPFGSTMRISASTASLGSHGSLKARSPVENAALVAELKRSGGSNVFLSSDAGTRSRRTSNLDLNLNRGDILKNGSRLTLANGLASRSAHGPGRASSTALATLPNGMSIPGSMAGSVNKLTASLESLINFAAGERQGASQEHIYKDLITASEVGQQLIAENKELRHSVTQLEQGAKAASSSRQQALDAAQQEIATLQRELQQAKQTHATTLQQQDAAYSSALEGLQAQLATATQEGARAREEHAKLLEAMTSRQREAESRQTQIVQSMQERLDQQARETAVEMQQSRAKAQQEIALLQGEMQRARDAQDLAARQREVSHTGVMEHLQAELHRQSQACQQAQDECRTLKQALSTQEQALARATAQVQEGTGKLEQQRQQHAVARKQWGEAQAASAAQSAAASTSHRELQARHDTLALERAKLVSESRASADQHARALHEAQQRVEQLTAQYEAAVREGGEFKASTQAQAATAHATIRELQARNEALALERAQVVNDAQTQGQHSATATQELQQRLEQLTQQLAAAMRERDEVKARAAAQVTTATAMLKELQEHHDTVAQEHAKLQETARAQAEQHASVLEQARKRAEQMAAEQATASREWDVAQATAASQAVAIQALQARNEELSGELARWTAVSHSQEEQTSMAAREAQRRAERQAQELAAVQQEATQRAVVLSAAQERAQELEQALRTEQGQLSSLREEVGQLLRMHVNITDHMAKCSQASLLPADGAESPASATYYLDRIMTSPDALLRAELADATVADGALPSLPAFRAHLERALGILNDKLQSQHNLFKVELKMLRQADLAKVHEVQAQAEVAKAAATTRIGELQGKLKTVQGNYETFKTDSANAIFELASKLSEAEGEVATLREGVEQGQGQVGRLRAQLEDQLAQERGLEAELTGLRVEVGELLRHHFTMQGVVPDAPDAVLERVQGASAPLVQVAWTTSATTTSHASLAALREDMQSSVAAMNAQLQAQHERLRTGLQHLREREQQQSVQWRDTVARLEEQGHAQQAHYHQELIKRMGSQDATAAERLHAALQEAEERQATVQAALADTQAQAQALRAERDALTACAEATATELSNRLASLQAEKDALVTSAAQGTQELVTLLRQAEAAMTTMRATSASQLAALQEQLAALRAEYARQSAELAAALATRLQPAITTSAEPSASPAMVDSAIAVAEPELLNKLEAPASEHSVEAPAASPAGESVEPAPIQETDEADPPAPLAVPSWLSATDYSAILVCLIALSMHQLASMRDPVAQVTGVELGVSLLGSLLLLARPGGVVGRVLA